MLLKKELQMFKVQQQLRKEVEEHTWVLLANTVLLTLLKHYSSHDDCSTHANNKVVGRIMHFSASNA